MLTLNIDNKISKIPKVIYRKDYKEPNFLVKHIFLNFNIINYDKVEVTSFMVIAPNGNEKQSDLTLNGEDFTTDYIKLNGTNLNESLNYTIENNILAVTSQTIKELASEKARNNEISRILKVFAAEEENYNNFYIEKKEDLFILETKVIINPASNTKLMGIYKSQNYLCSQCEPEGFRRITWYVDRPDNMAAWSVSIEGDKDLFPILLSNGNKIESKNLSNNRHKVIFNDPFNKPSYLFALVAGDFDCLHQNYVTKTSNKKIDLYIYTNKGEISKAGYAMESLKRAIEWDEKTFGLEYDLNLFSIVAVRDFNFGAMENKSLNIFNEVYVLANPNLATDMDFIRIEAVVGHEYFHNYTGNRVTCRDWFQLTLKEGLTVFRDHKFTESLHYKDCMRISNIELLRNKQFQEDSSPLAHPIRPDSYIEIDNFYTKTVYEKGAEVVRMIETLIGENNFKKGVTLYLNKFDGTAATCENFLESMEEASGISLEHFKKWYSSKGTPIVNIETNYNEATKRYTIKLVQTNNLATQNSNKDDANLNKDNCLVIPLKMALLSNKGELLPLSLQDSKETNIAIDNKVSNINTEHLLVLDRNEQQFIFNNVTSKPILSINRDFSAPVIINYKQNNDELATLIQHDNNGFIRCDAAKNYLTNIVLKVLEALTNNSIALNNTKVAKLLNNKEIELFIKDKAKFLTTEAFLPFSKVLDCTINNTKFSFNNIYLSSMLMALPSFEDIAKNFKTNLPLLNIYNALNIVKVVFAKSIEQELLAIIDVLQDDSNSVAKEDYAKRALKNIALNYLVALQQEQYFKLAKEYYYGSQNMTKRIAALNALKDYTTIEVRDNLFKSFLNEYKKETTVINKYLALEALSLDYGVVNKIKSFMQNEELFSFSNPNKVWHLLGSFVFSNHLVFHKSDGESYNLLVECILKVDKINASVAAYLATAFSGIARYSSENQVLMLQCVNKILKNKDISKGAYEILSKILESTNES